MSKSVRRNTSLASAKARSAFFVLSLALFLMLGASSAFGAELPTSTSVTCKIENTSPVEYVCTTSTTGNEIGTNAFKDLHELGRPNAMSVDFTSANTASDFPNGPHCTPSENVMNSGEVAKGTTHCAVRFAPTFVGANQVTAEYSSENVGGTVYQRSSGTSSTEGFDAPTTTSTAGCTPTTLVAGQTTTCSVSVSDAAASAGSPTGFVAVSSGDPAQISDNGCVLVAAGARFATCTVSITPTEIASGNPLITLRYGGASLEYKKSELQTHLFTVQAHPTETSLSCTPAQAVVGQPLTCTAGVVDTSTFGNNQPGGSIALSSDGTAVGSCGLRSTGSVSEACSVTFTPSAAGSPQLKAVYTPDANHLTSQVSVQLRVDPAPTPTQGGGGSPGSSPKPGAGTGTGGGAGAGAGAGGGAVAGAPNTTLKAKPHPRTSSHKARFTFSSDQAGSTFQCKLDKKPFKPCRSPFVKTVLPGKHVFKVRAVNAHGVADASPAVFSWHVR